MMSDMNEAKAAVDEARAAKRKRLFRLLGIMVTMAAVAFGAWWLIFDRGRVTTDNAYVGGDTAQVTPLVAGNVKEVRVGGTQAVKAGDVLVVLDDADYRIALAQAEAQLALAEQRWRQSGETASAASARIAARETEVAAARARLVEADANLARARLDLQRREKLASSGAVSGEELSSARAAFETAQAARDSAAVAIAGAEATRASAARDAAAARALVAGTTLTTAPDVRAARAAVERARLDLERTVLRAPIAGIVTNRNVQIGQRVNAGTPLMVLVPTEGLYVDANFKEGQLKKLKPGQKVELKSDLYGGDVTYHGRVEGFAGGTGAAFALIPAQNATGNWVKVVQRLPVRVTLDPAELKAHPLRVGLSMEATVDTRD